LVVTIPAAEYAVFTQEGPLLCVHDTTAYIFGTWLPGSDYELIGIPDFEYYGPHFDPKTMTGELAYWMPVRRLP